MQYQRIELGIRSMTIFAVMGNGPRHALKDRTRLWHANCHPIGRLETDMSRAADLELASVVKRYGETIAVDGISLKIKAGTYCCLLGPSGCGKTSTLRMIAGHEAVSDGDIVIGNKAVGDTPPAARGTAMMFQNYALFPHLSVIDNVAFSLRMKGVGKAERHARARETLQLVAMEGLRSAAAGPAFRRPAAACRAGTGAGHRSAYPAA